MQKKTMGKPRFGTQFSQPLVGATHADPATEILDNRELLARISQLESTVREIRNLVGPFGVLFPDGTMLVQTIHGTKYFIDPNDEIMAPQLVVYRQWEPDLSAFLVNSATPDTVFMDVGANFGYFTCLVASRIGTTGAGRVIAAEPNPAMQKLLRKNIRVNWSMSPIGVSDCAVAEQEGYLEFSIPTDRAANASLTTANGNPSDTRLIVRTTTLDQLAEDRVVDLIKIDVEGFETAVLRSGLKTIQRSPNIIIVIEWSQMQMRDAGFTPDALIEMLQTLQLRAYHLPGTRFIEEQEWAKLEIPFDTLREVGYDNILLRRAGLR